MSEHLYIHVPFCRKKCLYCDFYSKTDLSLIPDYVSGLIREIRLRSASAGRSRSSAFDGSRTVYFGGGTPSVLPLNAIEKIMAAVTRFYGISSDAEITLEANPGTLDAGYLKGLRRLGVNRLSLGVQSFDDRKLDLLGRIHTGDQALGAFETAKAAGFDNIGLDLIYGIPGETESDWQRDLDRAVALSPAHLSCYMLTLEPGTPLYAGYEQGRFQPMSSQDRVRLFTFTSECLERAGYGHYEISNFAGGNTNRSRHNSAYWRRAPYDGFGPSAHSYGVEKENAVVREVRSWNRSDLSAYTAELARGHLPVAESEIIDREQQMLELIMVGLRTREGMDVDAFNRLSSRPFEVLFKDLLLDLTSQKLGGFGGHRGRFFLTLKGWARLDSIIEAFALGLD